MNMKYMASGFLALTLSAVPSHADETAASKEKTWQDDVKLYPVGGPIADATPNLVIKGVSTSNKKQSEGTITFTLPEDVSCEGKWSVTLDQASPMRRATGSHPHVASATPNSEGGVDIKHKTQSGEGEGKCSDGAAFILFYVRGVPVIKDTSGNIFRMKK